jgi:hypothetical protein
VTPLHITAEMQTGFSMPHTPLALDGLLAAVVAQRRGLVPPRVASDCEPVEIPIRRETGGRFHLASVAVYEPAAHELRYVNRRAPIEEYQAFGVAKIRRVKITAGEDKSYRIPHEVVHTDRVEWWCSGDQDAIVDLLVDVSHIGKRRAVGRGRVHRWAVEPCAPWDGFPVVRDGRALRTLPADWPGLVRPRLGYRVLSFPYWDHAAEQMCAVP